MSLIRTEDGRTIWTVQIAGLMPGVLFVDKPGVNIKKGERFA